MNEVLKKELWKVFSVVSFLFVTIFFVLPYLVQISIYFHERGHQGVLDKYGVENSYDINLLDTIPNFLNPNVDKLGVTRFDLKAYGQLSSYEKAEVNIAGIVSDMRFLFLIGIYLAFVNVYIFYKVRIKKDYDLIWVLGVNWILFMWLLALIQMTVSNLTYGVGDFYQLVKVIG